MRSQPLASRLWYNLNVAYLREIITDGHPVLRKVAKRVEPSEIHDRLFQQMLDDMFETMYEAPGIGLAAPQINISKRVFVVDLQDDDRKHGPLVVVNPKFIVLEGEIESIEGCLSVPGMIGDLTRYERVVCIGLDRRARKIELEGTGLFGRCLQHEMDHLDGILYIDKAKNLRPAVTEEEKAALEAAQAGAEPVEAEPVEAP
ncbi:MAG: peptide deformylase [Candidatus Baltobacteraceae bacterium]